MQLALKPQARRSDPWTAKEAARSVRNLTNKQTAVLSVLKGFDEMTDVELVKQYQFIYGTIIPQSDSGIRTRRAELVKKGLVKDTGKTATLPSNRRAILWRAV